MSTSEQDGLARKQRSEAILAAEGVPMLTSLPLFGIVTDARLRSREETANRVIALLVAAVYGESVERDLLKQLTKQWKPDFTPKERKFTSNKRPTEHERLQFTWRYEGIWVLLWSLGFVEDVGRPDRIVDVPALAGLMRDLGPKDFRAKAKLRDIGQILDLLDLTFRYDWACVDARINNREAPAGLDAGVVMERHYALNWLTCFDDADWDDVSTPT